MIEIEDIVETHLCKLCVTLVALRSRVLRVLYVAAKYNIHTANVVCMIRKGPRKTPCCSAGGVWS